MSNFRDQLKKANLLSKKDAKRIAHEERIKRKEVGQDQIESEQAARKAELERIQAEQRESDRERQAKLEAERKQREERAACKEILSTKVKVPGRGGNIRWFFETEDGFLPWISIGTAEMTRLQGGDLWVIRQGAAHVHSYGLLEADIARRVAKMFPERIAWRAPA